MTKFEHGDLLMTSKEVYIVLNLYPNGNADLKNAIDEGFNFKFVQIQNLIDSFGWKHYSKNNLLVKLMI